MRDRVCVPGLFFGRLEKLEQILEERECQRKEEFKDMELYVVT